MAWVAVIGGAVTLGTAAIKADASESAGSGSAGAMPTFSNPSAASYGTTIGNDGWSINFGAGTQIATPSETNSASYPQQQNPLNQLQPVQQLGQVNAAGMDPQTLLLLAVGGLVLVKALRK